VGSGIATRSAANVTISGPTTTVPSGYYSSAVTKTMSNAAVGTQYDISFSPQFSVNASGVVHVA